MYGIGGKSGCASVAQNRIKINDDDVITVALPCLGEMLEMFEIFENGDILIYRKIILLLVTFGTF